MRQPGQPVVQPGMVIPTQAITQLQPTIIAPAAGKRHFSSHFIHTLQQMSLMKTIFFPLRPVVPGGRIGGSQFSNSTNRVQRVHNASSDSASGNNDSTNKSTRLASRRLTSFVYNSGVRLSAIIPKRIKSNFLIIRRTKNEANKIKVKAYESREIKEIKSTKKHLSLNKGKNTRKKTCKK